MPSDSGSLSSRIFVDHSGDVTVRTTAAGATQLLADESATLRAGTTIFDVEGDGDLLF